jgi:hypothetical protein
MSVKQFNNKGIHSCKPPEDHSERNIQWHVQWKQTLTH